MKYGIQMYSVRDLAEKDLRAALKCVADIGYKYVEFAGFFGHSAEEVRSWLDEFGLDEESYLKEADELAEFIYRAKAAGLDIICQCEHGQSRSAGCAAAILEHFSGRGIDIFANYSYYPSKLVYKRVLGALARYS